MVRSKFTKSPSGVVYKVDASGVREVRDKQTVGKSVPRVVPYSFEPKAKGMRLGSDRFLQRRGVLRFKSIGEVVVEVNGLLKRVKLPTFDLAPHVYPSTPWPNPRGCLVYGSVVLTPKSEHHVERWGAWLIVVDNNYDGSGRNGDRTSVARMLAFTDCESRREAERVASEVAIMFRGEPQQFLTEAGERLGGVE